MNANVQLELALKLTSLGYPVINPFDPTSPFFLHF